MAQEQFVPPSFTFGLELEMVYVFPKESFFILFPRIRDQSGADYISQEDSQSYVAAVLNHHWPPSFRNIHSIVGLVRTEDWYINDFNQWVVGTDCSIGAGREELARKFNLTKEEIMKFVNWDGIELVSPVFRYSQDHWMQYVQQVDNDLGPRNGVGTSYHNKSTSLHVHFALEGGAGFSLPFLKNLVVLWGIWEEVIETIHPEERHNLNNEYAQSLWRYKQKIARDYRYRPCERGEIDQDPSLGNFLHKVYGAVDVDHLRAIIGPMDEPKYSKLHISPPFHLKPLTIEFREHRGTTNSQEILWWVRLLERFLSFASRLTYHRWWCVAQNAQNDIFTQNLSLDKLLVLLQFDDEGKAFFNAKVVQYQQEAQARATVTPSSSGDNSSTTSDGE